LCQCTTDGELLFALCWLQNLKRAHQSLIHRHHRSSIIEFSTVIRCREKGDELSFRKKFVAVFHHLVSSTNEVEVVLLQEFGHDIPPESVAYTPIVVPPARYVLLWIGPQQIAHQALVWYICGSWYPSYLIHIAQIWRQATMHTENLLIDDCRNWHAVETISECLPKANIVASFAFVVKTIDSIDARTLVVSTQDEEIFWILDFVRE